MAKPAKKAPKSTSAGRKPRASRTALSSSPSVETEAPQDASPEAATSAERFKRPDLIDAVASQTAIKRSDARLIIELVLQELGTALDSNDELVLPPLGKLVVKKRDPKPGGSAMLTLKLKRTGGEALKSDDAPLAEPDEDS